MITVCSNALLMVCPNVLTICPNVCPLFVGVSAKFHCELSVKFVRNSDELRPHFFGSHMGRNLLNMLLKAVVFGTVYMDFYVQE